MSEDHNGTEEPTFECTGCGYQFGVRQPVTRAIIDCPNCEGETLALPLEEVRA